MNLPFEPWLSPSSVYIIVDRSSTILNQGHHHAIIITIWYLNPHLFRPNKADLEDALMELVDIDINEDNLDFSQVITCAQWSWLSPSSRWSSTMSSSHSHHHPGLPNCRQVPGRRRWETGLTIIYLLSWQHWGKYFVLTISIALYNNKKYD